MKTKLSKHCVPRHSYHQLVSNELNCMASPKWFLGVLTKRLTDAFNHDELNTTLKLRIVYKENVLYE